MVELGPLGPVDPATGRHPNTPAAGLLNYWVHGSGSEPLRKVATERCYLYRQDQFTGFDTLLARKKSRRRTYVARVVEDHAGRRTVRTERYDPERGSGSRTGHGAPMRVDIPQLPMSMKLPIAFFVLAVTVILMVTIPFPVSLLAAVAWNSVLAWKMIHAVERKRFAQHLRRLPGDLSPLLSEKELDARVFKLANPDEDRTFDEPPPIPMAMSLRDRAWQRWEQLLAELPDQEYQVGRMTYTVKQNNGFSDEPGHPLYQLVEEVRLGTAFCASYRDVAYIRDGSGKTIRKVTEVDGEDHETLRPLFEALGREVLGPKRVAELEDSRRAAAHGEAMLFRRFTARTDCADGHVGEHPILSTFTDSNGNKRVRRGCSWCPSIWSELV